MASPSGAVFRFPEPHELPPEQYTWFRQSRTEYIAASLTAQLLHWLILLGVSPDTIQRATRVVSDEVEHARMSHELYVHVGGPPEQVYLPPALLWHADDPGAPIARRVLSAVAGLAVEESVALPVFATRLRNAVDPKVVEVVTRIHKDEAFHRAFAWDALAELVEAIGHDEVRAWVRPRIAWWCRVYLLASLRDDEPVFSAEQLGLGLIDRREHWTLMRACIEEVVLPRFVGLGLLEEGVDGDALVREIVMRDGQPVAPWEVDA